MTSAPKGAGSISKGRSKKKVEPIVTKAILSAVTRSGSLPLDIARDLSGNLKGLADVAIDLPAGVGEAAQGLLGAGKGLVGGAASGAGKGAGDVQKALEGLGGLLGRQKK